MKVNRLGMELPGRKSEFCWHKSGSMRKQVERSYLTISTRKEVRNIVELHNSFYLADVQVVTSNSDLLSYS